MDDKIPKPQPKLTRGFSEASRLPTPSNASHLVRESPPPEYLRIHHHNYKKMHLFLFHRMKDWKFKLQLDKKVDEHILLVLC